VERLDSRVAILEGRTEEQGAVINGLRQAIVGPDRRIDKRFLSLEERMDRRFDAKVSRQFTWLVGLMQAVLSR
jgi:uncharacterized coiled-coil protein SlyX